MAHKHAVWRPGVWFTVKTDIPLPRSLPHFTPISSLLRISVYASRSSNQFDGVSLICDQVQIRLSIQRLRTLQEKRLAIAKSSRREIADLVQKGRVETARLRVEGLIQDDIYVELLEVLEVSSDTLGFKTAGT